MTLSLDAIDQAVEKAEIKTKSVPVPELGGSLTVRELTGTLRNAFEVAAAQAASGGGSGRELEAVTLKIVAACTLADEGKPLGDVRCRQIYAKKPSAIFRLRDEIVGLSAFSEEDLEELAEGFAVDPSGDSTSG